MTPFLARRRADALLTLSLALLAASALACGGTSGNQLFGAGGSGGTTSTGTASTSSGGGATSTSSSTGTASTSSSTSSSGATTTSSSTSSSGTTTTSSSTSSSGATTTSSSTSSSGSVGCQPGYVCVDPAPQGSAPGYLYLTETTLPAAGPPPACPANLSAYTTNTDPAGPAQCTACTCGPIEGAMCSPAPITCWGGSTNCGSASAGTDWTNALADGTCQTPSNLLNGATQLSCKTIGAATVTSPGACTPSGVSFPNQNPWDTRIDACVAQSSAGSCGTGQVCIPEGSGNPNESLCVRFDGTVTCPAGWTKTIMGYDQVTDTRACTACSCGDGATCGDSHYTFYDTATCTSASANGSINVGANGSNACTDVTSEIDQPMWSAKATLPQVHGNCPPGGGQATGMVTPAGPSTFCCQ